MKKNIKTWNRKDYVDSINEFIKYSTENFILGRYDDSSKGFASLSILVKKYKKFINDEQLNDSANNSIKQKRLDSNKKPTSNSAGISSPFGER